jgi:hypothetical protein
MKRMKTKLTLCNPSYPFRLHLDLPVYQVDICTFLLVHRSLHASKRLIFFSIKGLMATHVKKRSTLLIAISQSRSALLKSPN